MDYLEKKTYVSRWRIDGKLVALAIVVTLIFGLVLPIAFSFGLSIFSGATLNAIAVGNLEVASDFVNIRPASGKVNRKIEICNKLSVEVGTTSESSEVLIDGKEVAKFDLTLANPTDSKLITLAAGEHTYQVSITAIMLKKLYQPSGRGILPQTGEMFMPYWEGSKAVLKKVDSCL